MKDPPNLHARGREVVVGVVPSLQRRTAADTLVDEEDHASLRPEEKRLWRHVKLVAELPERDQRAVLRLIDTAARASGST